ncbi:MAG: hypothetical protein ACYDD4_03735 [Acidimicrobiales bacterium]
MSAVEVGRVLGGHLAHVVLFGGWGLVIVVVLIWPHVPEDADGRPIAVERPGPDQMWLQAAFLGSGAAAVTHYAVMPDHFRQSWLYGAFFLCAATAQVVVAVALLVRPSRRLLWAAASGSLAVVVLWAVSRFVGVPIGPDNGATEHIGPLDVTATLCEVVCAVACLQLLRARTWRPSWRWTAWALPLRLSLLVVAVGVPLTSALSSRS